LFELDVVLCPVSVIYHSNTEAVLFACLSSDWATITGRLLVSLFPKKTATRYRIGSRTKISQTCKISNSENIFY